MEVTAAFISVLLIGLSLASPHSRILGGENAERGSAVYIASLQEKHAENGAEKLFHFCGGAILNDKWILTAAHCFKNRQDKELFVAVGLTQLTEGEGGEIYQMEKFIIHENYDHYDVINDIALLKVKGTIKFSEKVSPVILGKEYIGSGIELTLNGWGITEVNSNTASNKLHVMQTKSFSFDECLSYHYRPIRETHLCAMAKKGTSACSGDSGGPLIMGENTLVGLVSWGMHPCGENLFPDVYTRITSYLDWIDKNMSDD